MQSEVTKPSIVDVMMTISYVTDLSFICVNTITYSSVNLFVTSSMRRAASVTFLVAFFGRIFFSPVNNCVLFCSL